MRPDLMVVARLLALVPVLLLALELVPLLVPLLVTLPRELPRDEALVPLRRLLTTLLTVVLVRRERLLATLLAVVALVPLLAVAVPLRPERLLAALLMVVRLLALEAVPLLEEALEPEAADLTDLEVRLDLEPMDLMVVRLGALEAALDEAAFDAVLDPVEPTPLAAREALLRGAQV